MSHLSSSSYQEAVDHSDSTDQVAATHSCHKSQYKVALRFWQCRGWIINISRRLKVRQRQACNNKLDLNSFTYLFCNQYIMHLLYSMWGLCVCVCVRCVCVCVINEMFVSRKLSNCLTHNIACTFVLCVYIY